MATAPFPWDSLKAESLRFVCRDLGRLPGRRDEMITFLKAVEEQGLENALALEVRSAPEQKPAEAAATLVTSTPSLKRNRQPVVSDYNTRHRDKRVRVSDPGPGLSRRQAARRANGTNTSQAAKYSAKMKTVPKAEATTKGRRTIFDGVLLPRFYPPVKEKEKEKETETEKETEKEKADAVVSDGAASDEKGEEVEADNEEKGEEGVDHVLEGLEDSKVESSLASSNKENEGIYPGQVSNDEPAPDVDSSHTSQSVEVAPQMPDEDMDAEGEMEQEHEAVVRQASVAVHPEIGQPSPEDVSHIEQVLELALALESAVETQHAL